MYDKGPLPRANFSISMFVGNVLSTRIVLVPFRREDGSKFSNVRQESDLLIVWRPSALPIIAELGKALPALFEAGSDIAIERNMSR